MAVVAYCNSNIPIIFWTDASASAVWSISTSPSASWPRPASPTAMRPSARRWRDAHRGHLSTSDWAAAIAVKTYDADASKVRVVPFGGNVAEKPSQIEVETFVAARDNQQCNLLLNRRRLGTKRRRHRRRGRKELEREGLFGAPYGSSAAFRRILPSRFRRWRLIPFVDKSTSEGARRFSEICRRSHFLLTPSRAEAFGVAIIEGNYFGLPLPGHRCRRHSSRSYVNETNGCLL